MHQLPRSELRVLEVSLRLTCCEHGMGMGELPICHTLLSRFETLTIRALSSKGLHRDTDLSTGSKVGASCVNCRATSQAQGFDSQKRLSGGGHADRLSLGGYVRQTKGCVCSVASGNGSSAFHIHFTNDFHITGGKKCPNPKDAYANRRTPVERTAPALAAYISTHNLSERRHVEHGISSRSDRTRGSHAQRGCFAQGAYAKPAIHLDSGFATRFG